MRFIVSQESLREELEFIQGIIEKKSTIPASSNVLIRTIEKDKIKLVATDYDTFLITTVSAEVLEKGSTYLPGKKLFDIIRFLDPGNVTFTKEGNELVQIESGRSSFRLANYSGNSFPEVPAVPELTSTIDCSSLALLIQMTSFAVTQKQIRYTLSGAKFESKAGKIRMVTTDGHRLALIEKDIPTLNDVNFDILIPKKALSELSKLANKGEICRFGEDQNLLYFQIGERSLIVRKLAGQFPNYEMVIPKTDLTAAKFDVNEMKSAIRRVSLMADERNKIVKMTLNKDIIEIESEIQGERTGYETISADYDGQKISIGFNAQYFQDFLNVVSISSSGSVEKETEGDKAKVRVSSTKIKFEFKDSCSQVLMRPLEERDYNYMYIVMPVNL